MGELISIIGLIKEVPATFTFVLVLITVGITLFLRIKDADIQGATSVSKSQNEKLMALMDQNEQLLKSVSNLQEQVTILHKQMNIEADEHRAKLEQTYKIVDDMRTRISELEDLVRIYQKKQDHLCILETCPNRRK